MKRAVRGGVAGVDRVDRPRVFQRIIEFEFQRGDRSFAKVWIVKAIENKIDVAFDDPRTQDFYNQVRPAGAYRWCRTPAPV